MKAWLDKRNPNRRSNIVYGDEHLLEIGVNKRCSKCKQIKLLEDFNRLSSASDGRGSFCRNCTTLYVRENREMYAKLCRDWSKRNKQKVRAKSAKRRTRKLNAVPPWLNNNDKVHIESIYFQSLRLRELTGIKYAVDHIIPLQGKNVCGLHVPWNLMPITASENSRKKNKFKESESIALTEYNEQAWLKLQRKENENYQN